MAHGLAKLARGPHAFAVILQAIGVPEPDFMAWATILIEVLGGAAVMLGFLVRIVSVPMAAVIDECRSERLEQTQRAANVEALNSCSAYKM